MTSLRLCAAAIAAAVIGLAPNGAHAKSGGHSDSSHANATNTAPAAKKTKKPDKEKYLQVDLHDTTVTHVTTSSKKKTTKPKVQDLSVTKKQDKASPQ